MKESDWKFINLISTSIDGFSRKGENVYNFKCLFCGDSSKNKSKKRAYLICNNDTTTYYCHNCSISLNLKDFIKEKFPALYNDYITDSFIGKKIYIEKKKPINTLLDISKSKNFNILKSLPKISDLDKNHIVRKYLENRKIPTKYLYNLFYVDKFKEYTNTFLPDKFKTLDNDEPRIIFPLTSQNGDIIGYQGRSLDKSSKIRYITIILNEYYPKIYGLSEIDTNYKIYVTEGPIDSMMLDNAIASCGGAIISELEKLNILKHKFIIIYDNEPRNPDVVRNIRKTIEHGYSTFLWPSDLHFKDLNEWYCNSAVSFNTIKKTIDSNVYSGLNAELRFSQWRKV